MKKAILLLLSAALLAGACQKYDDSVLKNRIGDLENRVTTLESTVNTLNGNVSSVQTLVQALQDDITISVISKNKDGFTITFSDGQTVEIRNGENGKDGNDGKDGKDGVNGAQGDKGDKGETPVIGVKAEDGVFFWTVDGEWLVDASGNKVGVSGGVPTLKIENDHWFVSYDGTNWQDLGKVDVTGGTSDLSITEDDNFVYFAFKSTGETIKISKSTRFTIDIEGTDFVLQDEKTVEIPYTLFGADGTEHLFIQGNGFTSSYDATKIYVTPNEGVTGGDVLVYAVRNSDQRVCAVVLSFGEGVFTVTEAAKVPAEGGDVSVTVRTNLTYEVVIPEDAQSWLSVAVSTKAAVREDAVTFTAQPNEGAARTAAVSLKAQGVAPLTVTIYQEGKGGSTPDGVKAVTVSEFLAAAESDSQVYELVGVIGGSINTTYGNFDLTDDSGTVYVYGLTATELGYGEKNDKSFASLDLNKGDTIKLHGYRGSYTNTNTGETKDEVVYAWFIEKIASGDSGQGGDTPGGDTGDVKAVTVSEFLAAAESETQVYELVGVIGGSINTTYGNFDLTDDSGTVYVYGLTATELGYGAKNDKSFASLDLNQGDTIKLRGYRGSFNGKDEVMYAWFIEKIASGDSGQGGDTPGGGEVTGDFASNVEWSLDSSAYSQDATVNGTEGVSVLKLGTAKVSGSATLTLPSASTKLSFYAISWNNATVADLVFKVNGKEVGTVTPASNSGLAGNPTYTLTVTDSDYYTIDLGSAVTTVTVETSGGFRAALFGIQAK